MNYISVEEATGLPGLRIAFTRGVPAPWGEAVRAFVEIKGIQYVPVAQEMGAANAALQAWTGHNSAPVAVFNDESPRAYWADILMLAERLRPEPRLIPAVEEDRAAMFGLCHEICAEDGFGWSTRLVLFAKMERKGNHPSALMKSKYGQGYPFEHARKRMNAIVNLLADRLVAQQANGSGYFIGDSLSAVDIYWTAFSNLVRSMPHDVCPMPDYYRALAEESCAELDEPLPEILVEHRDRMLQAHFKLPMWF
jgi:glutathione S-transferase